MTLPIPSGLMPIPMGEVRRSTEILPPSAPVGISGIVALDSRQALRMPEPVVTADQSSLARQALERNFQESLAPNTPPHEPSVTQAALLEISDQAAHLLPDQLDQLATNSHLPYASDPLSNLLDSTGLPDSANVAIANSSLSHVLVGQALASSEMNSLNQLISDILSKQMSTQSPSGNVPLSALPNTVLWPSMDVSSQNELMTKAILANDPKAVLSFLRENLKHSGMFAAEQLAHALLPANDISSSTASQTKPEATSSGAPSSLLTAQLLMQQLDSNSSSLVDAIRLALKGQLSWEGRIASNLPAKIKREDAWEANPNDPSQIIKGTRISVEVSLPNLGTMTVVGTQFIDQLQIQIQVQGSSVADTFQSQLSRLQAQLQEQDIAVPNIKIQGN